VASGDSDRFDVVVVGAGPAGETVASRLADEGMSLALVERELVGGECAYWACIPSKTLLRPGEARNAAQRAPGTTAGETRWRDVAKYRDFMVRNLDDSDEIKSYEESGVRVFKGDGVLRGPGAVAVGDRVLRCERIVLATGTLPLIPPIDGLAEAGYWTNREVTALTEVPDSVIILGGGPVGIEFAQLLRGFGTEVALVEAAERLLAREEPRVGELIVDALRADGIDVRVGAKVTAVSKADGQRTVQFGDERLSAKELVVAVGRRPRVDGLGLETVGLEPGEHGIEVDERCRAGEGIWAIGDVTGVMPFTHAAMYQGRIVVADIAGREARADFTAIPRVVFCDPEVAAVGLTEQQARAKGIDVVSATIKLRDALARSWTYETDPRGELALLADRERRTLAGAWAVGPLASEWIHYGALAIKAQIPIPVLLDTVAQFPTFSEAYQKALERLEL
jgi:dihydrolipoamide dehydrogenase